MAARGWWRAVWALAALLPISLWAQPDLSSIPGLAESRIAISQAPAPLSDLVAGELELSQPRPATATTNLLLSTLTRFRYRIGGALPPAQSLRVTASAEEADYSLSAQIGTGRWVRFDRTGGRTPDTAQVSIDPSGLEPGTYTGTITASSVEAGAAQTNVILDVLGPQLLTLDQEVMRFEYTRGGPVPASRTARVGSVAEPLDFTIGAASAGNWLTATPAVGRTPSNLVVGVAPEALNPGTYTGQVNIVAPLASNGPLSIQVVLTVAAGTLPAVRRVVNAASGAPEISSGSWVSIFGENLARVASPGRQWAGPDFVGDQLPLSLDGVSVRINNRPAAVAFISGSQLNVQAPDDTAEGTVPVEVTTPAGTARGTAEFRRIAPAFFVRGLGQVRPLVAAVHADGVLVGRPESEPGTRRARPGDTVVAFATGFGLTNPRRFAGLIVGAAPLVAPFTVRIGGVPAAAAFGGLVGVGLNQFNFTVPELADGDYPIVIETEGRVTQTDVFLPVRR